MEIDGEQIDEVLADEHCTLAVRSGGLSLIGTVLGSEDGVPIRIEYRVLADSAGLTSAVHVRDLRGFDQQTLTSSARPRVSGP